MANRLNKAQRYASRERLANKIAAISGKRPVKQTTLGIGALRQVVLDTYGSLCMACGSLLDIQVDHIKARSTNPELIADFGNLQVLCGPCNFNKWHERRETDYRQ